MIGRREFIGLLGEAAAAWPLAAEPMTPLVRCLDFGSAAERTRCQSRA